MKKQISWVLVGVMAAVSALSAGCKGLSTQGMVLAATQNLEIPVFLWAMDDDVCAKRQLNILYNAYSKRSGYDRDELTRKFKATYKAVVILATKDLGPTTGKLQAIRLLDAKRYIQGTKTVLDARVTESGKRPVVDIDKGDASSIEGKVLSIRPFRSEDKADKELYLTYDEATYAAIGGRSTRGLASEDLSNPYTLPLAVAQGKAFLATQGFADADMCGKLADIEDLF